MAGRLAGKVALISGASRGIGAAEARLFAAEGAGLVLGDVRDKELEALRDELREAGSWVESQHLDVTSEADWESIVALAESTFGRLDILVNNAGILLMAGLEDTTLEAWNEVLAVNQTGSFLGLKAAIPALRRAGGGSVINTSSIYGLVGSGAATAYQATKGAVRIMSKTAAIQYVGEGIRVNSLHPGPVDTPMVDEGVPEAAMPSITAAIPMGRWARPEEIAYGALFLASDEASYVTGSELVIDGGYTAP